MELVEMERLFGITLTGDEKKYLTSSTALLSPLEQQYRYLLTVALQPKHCPVCGYIMCQRSAYQGDFTSDLRGPDTKGDDNYKCPSCGTRLIWRMGLIGGDTWFDIAPGQTVTIRDKPQPPAREPDTTSPPREVSRHGRPGRRRQT